MAIRLETSRGAGIENEQQHELSSTDKFIADRVRKGHPRAIPRTPPSNSYNCHGMTFASRRTRIFLSSCVKRIMEHDGYQEVEKTKVLAGDIVLYSDAKGDINHSGIVVQTGGSLLLPLVCSMWGSAGEFVHGANDHPQVYGPNIQYFRCIR